MWCVKRNHREVWPEKTQTFLTYRKKTTICPHNNSNAHCSCLKRQIYSIFKILHTCVAASSLCVDAENTIRTKTRERGYIKTNTCDDLFTINQHQQWLNLMCFLCSITHQLVRTRCLLHQSPDLICSNGIVVSG